MACTQPALDVAPLLAPHALSCPPSSLLIVCALQGHKGWTTLWLISRVHLALPLMITSPCLGWEGGWGWPEPPLQSTP